MYSKSNSLVSITGITRYFRVHNFAVETWMLEGLIPRCIWRNGRRYWSSDDINVLITGCPIAAPLEAGSSIKKFSRRPAAVNALSSVVAFMIALLRF